MSDNTLHHVIRWNVELSAAKRDTTVSLDTPSCYHVGHVCPVWRLPARLARRVHPMTPITQREGRCTRNRCSASASAWRRLTRWSPSSIRDPNRRPVDMAIVDDIGNLLAYARMDRCVRPTFARNKAYTSAIRRMDTGAFADQLKSQGRSVADFGHPRECVMLQGGL